MSGKALLIGVAVDGLTGVENDVDAMAEVLTLRGLTVERLLGKDATRAGILDAYERLIAAVGPDDAAVVYYSGHGGRATPPPADVPGPDLMDLQFIVPFDFHDHGPDEFRGITSVELSVLLARLTQKTDNTTVILDCCHAARMSREQDARVKAVARTPYEILRAHVARLQAQGLDTGLLRSSGNPNAVRIVACAPEQSAFEYSGDDGRSIGVLTESLTMTLRAAGKERVSWATVLDRVRHRVLILVPGQRPEAEGPARRLLFDTAEDDPLDSLRATDVGGGRLRLECAPLLGVRPGDTFVIAPPDGDRTTRIGDLTVDRVGPLNAEGPVRLVPGVSEVPLGARAHRVTVSAPVFPVSVPEQDPRAADLATALENAPLLRAADKDEHWLAQVQIGADGEVTIVDRIGPLHEPRPAGPGTKAQVIRDLTVLARAAALRGLTADTRWQLGAQVGYEWGLVRDGVRQPLPDSGATIRVGDLIYVSVRNDGKAPVYASLVDIGVAGRVTILTDQSPSGILLPPGGEYVFGFDDFAGVLAGIASEWPEGLAPDQARPETVLLLVTSAPHDFGALGQGGVARAGAGPDSPLAALLDQIGTGGARDFQAASGSTARYDVRALDFELDPAFLLEEGPDPALRRVVARGSAPAVVAVRIDELVVHRHRTVFGMDVRVDAIVLTGTADSPEPVFRARTERFSGIRNGEPLPLDRMLVYHGPAVDYLDIALWVSRDTSGGLDLGELLSDEVAGFEMQEALAKLGDSMAGVPYAAAAATMVGLGAVVVNVAYKLLRGSVNGVIGLYRGSMLAQEGFGLGRHPAAGVRRVQDFSFAYSIDEVS